MNTFGEICRADAYRECPKRHERIGDPEVGYLVRRVNLVANSEI